MAVNKISQDELGQAKQLQAVIPEFHQQFCSDDRLPVLAGGKVGFDVAFLKELYNRAQMYVKGGEKLYRQGGAKLYH